MRVGINVGHFRDERPERFAERVRVIDELGFDGIWFGEGYGSDVFTPLAWCAALTRRVRPGAAVAQIPARPGRHGDGRRHPRPPQRWQARAGHRRVRPAGRQGLARRGLSPAACPYVEVVCGPGTAGAGPVHRRDGCARGEFPPRRVRPHELCRYRRPGSAPLSRRGKRAAAAAIPAALVEEVALIGPAAKIRDDLLRWKGTVVDSIAVQGLPSDLELLAKVPLG